MATYALADLHGMMDLYTQILDFLKPSDKVYFLGDAADRGPHGWEIIKNILNNPQFTYIKGNHEDMLVCGAGQDSRGIYENPLMLHYQNGGGPTIRKILTQ